MRQSSADLNRIRLHGRLEESPVFSHVNHDVEFYRFPLCVTRLSGAEDRVYAVAPRALLEQCPGLGEGEEVTVLGEVRTFNNRSGTGSRLVINVFARELRREWAEDENRLELTGTLCKEPSLRVTPLGRTICDMILAVNRRYGRADYLPCITWGSLARRCGAMGVGDRLQLSGRLQSREYTKVVEGRQESRTAFEVSVMSLESGEGWGREEMLHPAELVQT